MRMKLYALTGIVAMTLPVMVSAQMPLNSLVARVDQPRGPIPAECEQGLSPAPPLRVDVREIDIPEPDRAEPLAPPSGALRDALHDTQLALSRNDRPAFNAALARAKVLLVSYPAGAERRTAEDIVRLHDTAARLWDAQYETPFFGENDPEFAMVRDLPGYAEAVRRSTLTDDKNRRFYPTAESREYVADLAGERLQRLGIRRNTPRASSTREEGSGTTASRPRTSTASPRSSTSRPRSSTTMTSQSPRRSSTPSASRSTSGSTLRSTSSRRRAATSDPAPTRNPAAVTSAPRSPNPTAPPTSAAVPAPASPTPSSASVAGDVAAAPDVAPVEGTPASATTEPPADVATETTLPAPAVASTPDTSVTTTNVIPATPPTSTGRSVILPTILILVGLGVLIVLFRASK